MKNKKIILIIIAIVIMVFVLMAISKTFIIKTSKIICSSNGTTNNPKISQEYIIKYNKNDITNMKITKTYKYNDSYKFDKFEMIYNNTLSNYKSLGNSNLSYTGSVSNDTYKIILNVNVSKSKKEDLEKLDFNKNLNSMKTALENQGLICN